MKHWRITLMPSARIPFRMPYTSYKVICSYVNMLTSVGDVFANSSVIVSATVSKQTIIMLYFLYTIILMAFNWAQLKTSHCDWNLCGTSNLR